MLKGKVQEPCRTHLRVNDVVQVISGKGGAGLKRSVAAGEDTKDRQVRGKVIAINREKGRATVEGVKLVFKHQKVSRDPAKPNVGRIQKEASITLSNLMLVCPKCDEATRFGVRAEEYERGGNKKIRRIRVCKKCGADIVERA